MSVSVGRGVRIARRMLVGAGALALAIGAATPARATAPPDAVRRLVVVALPDATWHDLDPIRAPHLGRLLDRAAIGSVSLQRIVGDLSIADTAATVSAGARSVGGTPKCRVAGGAGDLVRCEGFADIRRDNAARRYGARTGLLGATLDRAAIPRAVQGPPSDAALALVDRTGAVPVAPLRAGAAGTERPSVTLVDGPRFHGDGDPASGLVRLDALLARIEAANRSPADAVMLVSYATPPGPNHLGVLAIAAPGWKPAGLRSATTDRNGVVQTVDLAPTILHLVGIEAPAAMEGRVAYVVGSAQPTAQRVRAARALDADAVQRDRMLGPATFTLAIAPIVLLALAAALHLARWRAPWLAALAGWVLAFPLTTYLTPFVVDARAGQIGYWTCTAAIAVAIGTLATGLAALRRRPLGHGTVVMVTGLGLVVLTLDLLRGGVVQYNAVFGYSATVGGRFIGSGNMTTGFLTALLLGLVAALAPRPGAVPGLRGWWPEAAWVVLTCVVAAPGWGSDVGGALFLVPTGVVLSCVRRGVRVRLRTLLGAALAAVGLVAVFLVVDLQRPAAQRTHLGRLLGGSGDGAAGLSDVVARKAAMAARSLSHTVWWWGVPVVVLATAGLAWLARRRTAELVDRYPALRACTVATVTGAVLGSLLNDSGLAVAGAVVVVAAPTFVALLADTDPSPAAALGSADSGGRS